MSQELFFGSLGGWVSWGLYHSYLFFFSFAYHSFLTSFEIGKFSVQSLNHVQLVATP